MGYAKSVARFLDGEERVKWTIHLCIHCYCIWYSRRMDLCVLLERIDQVLDNVIQRIWKLYSCQWYDLFNPLSLFLWLRHPGYLLLWTLPQIAMICSKKAQNEGTDKKSSSQIESGLKKQEKSDVENPPTYSEISILSEK